MYCITSNSVEETEKIGYITGKNLQKGYVVVLHGVLGAGKTAFTRGIALGMEIDGPVTSPTFSLLHHYPGKIPLFHFDLYRLNNIDEFYDLGFEEYINGDGVAVLEWGETLDTDRFSNFINIRISPIEKGENSREICFSGNAPNLKGIIEELKNFVNPVL